VSEHPEDSPPNEPNTRRDASPAPILPPPPAGAEYFDAALRLLMQVNSEQKQMFGFLLDKGGPVQKLASSFEELRVRIEKRERRATQNQILMLRELRSFRQDLGSLDARVRGVEERTDSLEELAQELDDRVDALEQQNRHAVTTPAPAPDPDEPAEFDSVERE
jgi:hypothetical protein